MPNYEQPWQNLFRFYIKTLKTSELQFNEYVKMARLHIDCPCTIVINVKLRKLIQLSSTQINKE